MDLRSTQADADRLGEALKRLRDQQRLSQADLKRLSGVSRETISLLERASRDPRKGSPIRPHPDTLRELARGLATDGKGIRHAELADRFYCELMVAAGYNDVVYGGPHDGDTGLIRTEAEITRWMREHTGDPDVAIMWQRALTDRRYLSPSDQMAVDNVMRLYAEKAERNKRDHPG